VHTCPVV